MRGARPVAFALAVAWWLCFRPGFFSGDSFGALSEASSGQITTSYTAAWPLFLRVVTAGGRFPGMATLIDVLVLVYALQVWCLAALSQNSSRMTAALMTATPLVGAIGITLWHDVPMTSGLLLLAAVATSTNWFSIVCTRTDYIHLAVASALVAFRPNGLPTLAGFFALSVLFRRNPRRAVAVGLACALIALAVSLAATVVTGNRSLVSSYFAQEWMRADVSCVLSRDVSLVRAADQERLSQIADISAWASDSACVWLNSASVDRAHKEQALGIIPGVWLNTALAHPLTLLAIHVERHAYLLPLPQARALTPPFIHSTIEFPDRGIAWANPRLAGVLRAYVRAWNAGRGLLAFAGLWLAVLIGLAIAGRRTLLVLGPTVLVALSLIALLLVTAPIPDGRYALFVLVTGQSALLGALLERVLPQACRQES